MSTTIVEVAAINQLDPHPNADRLEIATIGGASVVVGKGTFKVGEHVIYFPPNMLLPEDVSTKLGVYKYLRHSTYPGDSGASQCRVGACRLRGVPSFGFAAPASEFKGKLPLPGTDVSEYFRAVKYTPPPERKQGGSFPQGFRAPECPEFHKYTDIENYYRYRDRIPEGTPVRITEKLHGMNCRVGMIDGVYMAGSHNVQRKQPIKRGLFAKLLAWLGFKRFKQRTCVYWEALEKVKRLIDALSISHDKVIIFGEIYGPGVQDMDYGVPPGERHFRVFDISLGGQYLDWQHVKRFCDLMAVPTVPLLYTGPWKSELLAEYTYGPTTVGEPRCAFKDREGIVITALEERWEQRWGGRMILKSVSADYLARTEAEDN